MMIIELRHLVGNAICSLYKNKGIKSIDLNTLNKYQEAITKELKQKNIKFCYNMSRDKTNNFIMHNKYFDVYGEQNMIFILKNNITLEDLYKFRCVPIELLSAFVSEPVLKTLGIKKKQSKVFVKK